MDTKKVDIDDNVKYYKNLVKQNKVLLVLILCIIAISIFILNFNTFNNLICKEENKISINVQDIEQFNGQFTIYGGYQTGVQLKNLCQALILSAEKYKGYPFLPPTIIIKNDKDEDIYKAFYSLEKGKEEVYNDVLIQTYNENITYISENILVNKHSYFVEFEYLESGILNQITIHS